MKIQRPATSHIAPFGVRMQPELRLKLESAAASNGRSMNAEIVSRLQSSFEEKNKAPTTANLLIDDAVDAAAFEFSRFTKQLLDNLVSQQIAAPSTDEDSIDKKGLGLPFTINFGEQPSISAQFEGAYRRGYHQAVAEVAYSMDEKHITNAEQLNAWVTGSGMVWRKDMPLDRMTPPPPLVE